MWSRASMDTILETATLWVQSRGADRAATRLCGDFLWLKDNVLESFLPWGQLQPEFVSPALGHCCAWAGRAEVVHGDQGCTLSCWPFHLPAPLGPSVIPFCEDTPIWSNTPQHCNSTAQGLSRKSGRGVFCFIPCMVSGLNQWPKTCSSEGKDNHCVVLRVPNLEQTF